MGIKEFFGFGEGAVPAVPGRDEESIRTELGQAHKDYTLAVVTSPAAACVPLASRVKELRQELCDALSVGAAACPDCGAKPIGLRHVHVVVPTQRKTSTYEVGCINCKDHRVQGSSVSEAVAEWNAGKYLPPRG